MCRHCRRGCGCRVATSTAFVGYCSAPIDNFHSRFHFVYSLARFLAFRDLAIEQFRHFVVVFSRSAFRLLLRCTQPRTRSVCNMQQFGANGSLTATGIDSDAAAKTPNDRHTSNATTLACMTPATHYMTVSTQSIAHTMPMHAPRTREQPYMALHDNRVAQHDTELPRSQ